MFSATFTTFMELPNDLLSIGCLASVVQLATEHRSRTVAAVNFAHFGSSELGADKQK